jgi:hypothetical protein
LSGSKIHHRKEAKKNLRLVYISKSSYATGRW